jgi:hypothetical protein
MSRVWVTVAMISEEQGFDDLRAFDAQHVRQFLHREVVLWYNDHFGTHLLGFPGCPQLHCTPALTLTSGFFLALAHRRHRLGCRALLQFGF